MEIGAHDGRLASFHNAGGSSCLWLGWAISNSVGRDAFALSPLARPWIGSEVNSRRWVIEFSQVRNASPEQFSTIDSTRHGVEKASGWSW